MTLQKIYIQYEYQLHEYLLPDAELYVRDSMTGGDIFGEICYSAFDGTSTGCGFNLTEGWTYDVFSGKEGYKTGSNSQLLEFAPPVDPYILLWLYPREPSVVTHDATEITSTSAELNGELTNLDGCDEIYICFQYGKVGESYTQLEESWYTSTDTFYEEVTGLTPDTTYNFRIRGGNETEEDTFYVFGETKQFTTLEAPEGANMYIILPNANGKLFLSNTIIACDDSAQACTEFTFLITNIGDVTANAWYTVSVVGGATLYTGTVPNVEPNIGSSYIDDWICALPGGLPVGTHTIKVETGPEGKAATDSYSEPLYVIEEQVVEGMQIVLPNENGKLFLSNTVFACDDPAKACTDFNFQIKNMGNVTANATYNVTIVGGGDLYQGTVTGLAPDATSSTITDSICALPGGLPLGTHEIRVEVRPEGEEVTDAYTEELYVIEEGVVEGMQITLPYPNLLEDDTIITCDDPTKACTYFNFQIKNSLTYGWWPYYEVSIVGGATLYTGSPDYLAAGASTPIIRDAICALPDGLPIGEHTIEVKAYPAWGSVTDTHTEVLTVAEDIPVVTTGEPTDITTTTVYLAGHLVNSLDVMTDIGWEYGETTSYGSTFWQGSRLHPGAFSGTLAGLTQNTLYHFRAIATNDYGTGYGDDTTFTTLEALVEEPPSGVGASGERYLNVCGAEIVDNCITVNISVDHFGTDDTCSVHLEYWSEGDTEHNFTTPIVVPYDPEYDEEGLEVQGVEVCIPDCETDHYVRGVASNSVGSNHSETITPITVRLEEPTEITQTSVTLNAYIVSMGSISNGITNFGYGTTSPVTYPLPHLSISSTGAISKAITGLAPNTTYQYNLFARYAYGYPQTTSGIASFTTLEAPEGANMYIILPNANGKLFLSNTIIACDDSAQACTEFTFLITNIGDVTANAWYTVSVVGGATLYTGTVPNVEPNIGSSYIDDWICALPGGLPVGTHTIKVEVGPEGQAATDTYTEAVYVIEEGVDDMQIVLPYTTLLEKATIIYSDNETEGCTPYNFRIQNKGNTTIAPWYKLYIDNYLKHYNTIATLTPEATSPIINDILCAIADDIDIGTHTIKVEVGPEGQAATDTYTDTLYVTEWTTDITFIATAPGVSDLHNVDVNDITDPQNPKYLGTT